MLSTDQIIFRLVLAVVLGSVVGLERERLDWAAGLRTHMMVCLGAALFMIVSSFGFMDVLGHSNVSLDPSRVAAQVVSGIGFLGAGTIMFRRDAILGLTTAASLWAIAAVGLAVGGGMYVSAFFATFLILVILAVIKPIERRIFHGRRPRSLNLVIERDASLFDIEAAVEAADIRLKHILVQHGEVPEEHHVEVVLSQVSQDKLLPLVEELRGLPGVRQVSYAVS
jgi:putative Mg2+ transporter-C (MgtC) family protein